MTTKIDIRTNADLRDVSAESGGDVENEIRVTIASGVSKSEAFKALQTISSALVSDKIILE